MADADNLARLTRIAHEVNRALSEVFGPEDKRSWAQASPRQKDDVAAEVAFFAANPPAEPSAAHAAWLDAKRADGWSFAPEKSEADRTHPRLVPWDHLLPEQRARYHVVRALVRAELAA